MKKYLFLALGLFICFWATAQAPQGINYQAVIRGTDGQPIANQSVSLRITLQHESGTPVHFAETHAVTTSPQGVVSLTVGKGSILNGVFANIPWDEGDISIKLDVDPAGGTDYAELGVSILQSVPYALYAENASLQNMVGGATGQTLYHDGSNWTVSGLIHNTGTKVGIGTTAPPAKLTVVDAGGNPTIPSGTTSTGMFRLRTSTYATEGVDMGKMLVSPWLGWIQVGFGGTTAEPFAIQPLGGNVGIGTGVENPSQKLDINGLIRIREGNPESGKVLTAFDNTGVATWEPLPSSGSSHWTQSGSDIYREEGNVGIGLSSPTERLDVAGNIKAKGLIINQNIPQEDDPLFVVHNSDGKIVFAVYESGVRMYVDDTSKGSRGGFAIGGLSDQSKVDAVEYFRVTPDSVRINFNAPPSGVKGSRGGFAIGGLSDAGKVPIGKFMFVGRDSTRIYIEEEIGIKGSRGGFAIGGLSDQTKAGTSEFLRVTRDSTRVYVDNTATKGSRGGFAIGGLSDQTKAGSSNFMFLTPENYFIGHESGANTVPGTGNTGRFNTFFGYQTGFENITGHSNVFIGNKSGYNNKGHLTDQNLGSRNVYLGFEAGYSNTFGSDNVMLGYQSGYNNTTAGNNVCLGTGAGFSNKKNSDNVFIGLGAGYFHGSDGPESGSYKNNIYIGIEAGKGVSGTTMGKNNVYIGPYSGKNSTTAQLNVFMGFKTGELIVSGSENVFIGNEAGGSTQSGGSNTFIGTFAGQGNNTGNYNTFLGDNAGKTIQSGQRNTFIGTQAGQNSTSGNYNVFMGFNAGRKHSIGNNNVYIGYLAGEGHTDYIERGANNVFIGTESGQVNSTGEKNVFMGFQSGKANSSGSFNAFIGNESGLSNTTGLRNVFLGHEAGKSNQQGVDNIFIGFGAGRNNTGIGAFTGDNNVFIGVEAGNKNTDGLSNVFIGDLSGHANTTGDYNVYIGKNAGGGADSDFSVCVGAQAEVNGNNNISIGNMAGYTGTGTGCILIGNQAGFGQSDNNVLIIENSNDLANPLIHGNFIENKIAFHRTASDYPLRIGTDFTNGQGAYLTATGTWTNASSKGFKDRFVDLNGQMILVKITQLDVKGWYFKNSNEYHIGPFAEDFYNAFGTGDKNSEDIGKYLAASDVAGVSLRGVQELIRVTEEQSQTINNLHQEIDKLRGEIEVIKTLLAK